MEKNLEFEQVYPHPVSLVWRAITEPAALAAWLMENDFKPEVGHRFEFHTKPRPGFDRIVHCEVLEVDAPRRLVYSWKGGHLDTTVHITLEAVPGGTRLRLEHRGFRGAAGIAASLALGSGWKRKVLGRSLPEVLDRLAAGLPPAPGAAECEEV